MSRKYRIPLKFQYLKNGCKLVDFMPFLETRAHLQSFETKMEFIRPKLTTIWPFEICIFKKKNRKNRKAYRRQTVNKWWKTWTFSLKYDFFTFSLFLRQVTLVNLIVNNFLKFPSKFALFVNPFRTKGHRCPGHPAYH